jgi:hypothetical protein
MRTLNFFFKEIEQDFKGISFETDLLKGEPCDGLPRKTVEHRNA